MLVPFHKGNGTGGTNETSLGDYPEGRYAAERFQAGFLVPLVPLVPHRGWNGTNMHGRKDQVREARKLREMRECRPMER